LADKEEYINNSTSPQTQTLTFSKEISSSYTFEFGGSLKAFLHMSVEAGVPLVASDKVEAGIDIELHAGKSWTTEVKHTFSVSKQFTIAPSKKLAAQAVLKFVEGAEIPVKVKISASLYTMRLEELDCEGCFKVVTEPAPGKLVDDYLKENKVSGRIVSVEDNKVIFETDAVVKASYGLSTFVRVDEEDI